MDVYYRRVTKFCKYPFNDEIDEEWIEYSLSKRKFKIFATTLIDLNIIERRKIIASSLNKKVKNINLIKLK